MLRIFLLVTLVFCLFPVLSCSTSSYDDGYNTGFQRGYDKGWGEGYEEGIKKGAEFLSQAKVPVEAPSSIIEKTPFTQKQFTLAEATGILNLLPVLPATFEKVDAASEGMSIADFDLDDGNASEVQLFISEEPYQMIYGFLYFAESRLEQLSFKMLLDDDDMLKNVLIGGIYEGGIEEDLEIDDVQIEISHPDIGDSCCLGEGSFESYGMVIGFDVLVLEVENVYVFVASAYSSLDREDLLPIAKEIGSSLSQYSY